MIFYYIMDTNIIKKIEEGSYKKRPDIKIGDHVKLFLKIKDEKKERIQQFKKNAEREGFHGKSRINDPVASRRQIGRASCRERV